MPQAVSDLGSKRRVVRQIPATGTSQAGQSSSKKRPLVDDSCENSDTESVAIWYADTESSSDVATEAPQATTKVLKLACKST